jgi:dolichyl-diphosphooligosaccharide--protein glycosyltransferase
MYEFWNWYDSESWYPLGRVVGGTVYPGIMFTGVVLKKIVDFLGMPLDIRLICVFTAPLFSMFQCISTYQFTVESTNRPAAGLFAALFMAVVPAILSRGVAGSYDNEAVAVWALMNTFYLWIKACNTGSILWSVACTLNYFYMVASWGGYSFIINMIPVFVLGTMFINRFNLRIYVAYSIFYTLGSVLSMLITFVNFQVIRSSEHLASHITFFAMNVFVAVNYIRSNMAEDQIKAVLNLAGIALFLGFFGLFLFLTASGTTRISGRVMALIDPSYAQDNQLVNSVAEHTPSVWSTYFENIHFLLFFAPVGLYYTLMSKMTYGKLFLAMYAVFTVYFSCAMNRLVIVFAPSICILAGIAVAKIVSSATKSIRYALTGSAAVPDTRRPAGRARRLLPVDVSVLLLLLVYAFLKSYIGHSTLMSQEQLSSPTFIISTGSVKDGDRYIFDDFRETYYWLRQNTPADSKVMAWWDYGYQISGMSNRTVIVDNNTWNNTHIATVAKALVSDEETGY